MDRPHILYNENKKNMYVGLNLQGVMKMSISSQF